MMLEATPEKMGLFVVLEGIDGSGKTAVSREIVERLESMDIPARFTFEPSDHPIGSLLRSVLKGNVETSAHTHALLFAADREEHLREEVLPLVGSGHVVVCDRYVFASMAYQGAKGLDMDMIWNMNCTLPHFTVPDVTILLDIPPDISLSRTHHREITDIFETPEYLSGVRENYLAIAGKHGIIVVDACPDFETVVDHVMKIVLGKRMQHTSVVQSSV